MLARLVRELPVGDGLVYEPKWDGFRALAFCDADDVDIRSRNQRPLARYFPEIVEALRGIDAVLDGELLVTGPGGFDFEALMARLHPAASRVERLRRETPASYVVFDVVALGGDDLRDRPFLERRVRLERLLGAVAAPISVTPATRSADEARRWLAGVRGGAIDGVVVKPDDLTYQPGKRAMVKVKPERTVDCVVAGFRFHGSQPVVGSLLLGLWDDDGRLRHVGVASSFTAARRRELIAELAEHLGPLEGHPWEQGFDIGRSPLGRLRGAAGRWTPDLELDWVPLRVELVAEVAYGQLDVDRFRHPARLVRWRPDRDPASCSIHQLD
jgi:ATP-dependent DNA ligase